MSLATVFTDLMYGTPPHLIETMEAARAAFDARDLDKATDLLDICATDGLTSWHERAAVLAYDIANEDNSYD